MACASHARKKSPFRFVPEGTCDLPFGVRCQKQLLANYWPNIVPRLGLCRCSTRGFFLVRDLGHHGLRVRHDRRHLRNRRRLRRRRNRRRHRGLHDRHGLDLDHDGTPDRIYGPIPSYLDEVTHAVVHSTGPLHLFDPVSFQHTVLQPQ